MKIIVEIYDGIVQNIFCDKNIDAEVEIFDFDVETEEKDELEKSFNSETKNMYQIY